MSESFSSSKRRSRSRSRKRRVLTDSDSDSNSNSDSDSDSVIETRGPRTRSRSRSRGVHRARHSKGKAAKEVVAVESSDAEDDALSCVICLERLQQARQFSCHHHMVCLHCVLDSLTHKIKRVHVHSDGSGGLVSVDVQGCTQCPICRSDDTNVKFPLDNIFELPKLAQTGLFPGKGHKCAWCDFTGEYTAVSAHGNKCPERKIECPLGCGTAILVSQEALNDHVRRACNKVKCTKPNCAVQGSFNFIVGEHGSLHTMGDELQRAVADMSSDAHRLAQALAGPLPSGVQATDLTTAVRTALEKVRAASRQISRCVGRRRSRWREHGIAGGLPDPRRMYSSSRSHQLGVPRISRNGPFMASDDNARVQLGRPRVRRMPSRPRLND